jgi:acetyl esterase/lipase
MTLHRINLNDGMNMARILLAVFIATVSLCSSLQAVDLPSELPLWEKGSPEKTIRSDVKEQVRSVRAQPGSPSGLNRVFSSVSLPTYSIHRPLNPNGVGLVICPGGGFRRVWLDREGHDLAIWLKDHGVTCMVLKYRTRLPNDNSPENTWQNYQRIVQADGKQAIRILRQKASDLGLQSDKIGICGFSAGGHLAISCSLRSEPKLPKTEVSSIPDFAGLFYPGIPDDVGQVIESRTNPEKETSGICPMFIINARVDKLTPADKCVDFYSMLLKAGVNAEFHVFSKGSHGFSLGDGRGKSVAIWPKSFIAWLSDSNIIQD